MPHHYMRDCESCGTEFRTQGKTLLCTNCRRDRTGCEVLKKTLSELHDDLSLPWTTHPCLEWPGWARNKQGYGGVRIDGESVMVHRAAYEMTFGPLPEGKKVLHHCDYPKCYRPIHLFAGSQRENIEDSQKKGRTKFFLPSLTEEQVLEIRQFHAHGMSQNTIARKLDIWQGTVNKIVRRKTWTHL